MPRTATIAGYLLVAMLAAPAASSGELGLSGRIAVDAVVLDYRPTDHVLGVSVTLSTGNILEYETSDKLDVENILRLLGTFSTPGFARMYVVVEGDKIVSFQVGAGKVH